MQTTEKSHRDWDRLDRIRFLLDQWDAIFDAAACAAFGGSERFGVALLPSMANHSSVVELGRVLSLLRVVCPGDYRHLQTFRMGCEWRLVDVDARVRLPSGKWAKVKRRQRERVLPAWLSMVRVDRAERFLSARFRGDVNVPAELWAALELPADTAAWAAYDAKTRARRLAA